MNFHKSNILILAKHTLNGSSIPATQKNKGVPFWVLSDFKKFS